MFKTKLEKVIATCLVYGLASALTQIIRIKINWTVDFIFWKTITVSIFVYWLVSWKITPFSGEAKNIFQTNCLVWFYKYRTGNEGPVFWTKKVTIFLKFLKSITSLDSKTEIFDGDSYRIITFRVKDFLDVSHYHYNSRNEYYKMKKIRDFLLLDLQ